MARHFRLLQVSANFQPQSMPMFGEQARTLDITFSPAAQRANPHPFVSVVIGKNGVGKSRLLARIAGLFQNLDRNQEDHKPRDLPLTRVVYQCDQHLCDLRFHDNGSASAVVDGWGRKITGVPLPNKVVALTTTPFDKFKLPASLTSAFHSEPLPGPPERYVYLGLRQSRHSLSPTAVIVRSVDGLFEASHFGTERRMRIAEVFGFLGYEPSLEIRYAFAPDRAHWIREIAEGRKLQPQRTAGRTQSPPPQLLRMVERDPALIDDLQEACREALQRFRNKQITLQAQFEHESAHDGFFRQLVLLRRAGLIQLRAANLVRVGDEQHRVDLTRASSGELGIVTSFLGLASVIEDGSLIFIDEPEISLHPEWQMQYVDLLLKTFGHFSGCHFVLATHSPLILSDISVQNSTLVSLDSRQQDLEPAAELAGKSADYVLAAAFRAPGRNNLYLKQEIIKALRLAANGQAATDEFQSTLKRLLDLLPEIEEDSPASKLIRELKTAGETSETAE